MENSRITKSCTQPPNDRAGQDPQSSGKISELRRQNRADQRSGAGDGGKMVSEDHPLVGGNIIAPIVQPLGRGGTVRIEHEHFGRDEFAVEAVTDGVGADGGHHQPHGIDLFAPMQGDRSQCEARPVRQSQAR